MSIIGRMMGRWAPEKRRSATSWDHLGRAIGVDPATPAAHPDAVLSASSVATRCVDLRAQLMASVPLFVFQREGDGGRKRADNLLLFRVLHDQFNESMTAFEGREFLVRCLDLAGNGYARIDRNAAGEVQALYPFNPSWVGVERLASGRLRYKVSDPSGGTTVLLQEDMLHIRNHTGRDGITGQSSLAIARENMGLMIAQTSTALRLSTSGLSASGFLETAQTLEEQDRARLQQIMSEYVGTPGAGKLMILESGMKYNRLTWSPEDAELLASRKLSDESVARVFGIPPTSVGITDKATYSNVEQESTMLVRNALAPLARRVESAMAMRLLTADQAEAGFYVEHDLNGLLRGDTAARFQAYAMGRQWGWLSANDVRRAENMPPIENGDGYMQPLNMAPVGDTSTDSS